MIGFALRRRVYISSVNVISVLTRVWKKNWTYFEQKYDDPPITSQRQTVRNVSQKSTRNRIAKEKEVLKRWFTEVRAKDLPELQGTIVAKIISYIQCIYLCISRAFRLIDSGPKASPINGVYCISIKGKPD